jgi:hypothetical protein
MTTATMEVPETRSRKRAPARASARPVMLKTKVTLVLDDDAATRLAVYAAMTKQERSHVVGQLIRDHLRRFRVQDLDQTDRAKSPVEVIGGDPADD